MYRLLLLAIFILSASIGFAQNIDSAAYVMADDIYNCRYSEGDTCPDLFCWQRIYDSVEKVLTVPFFRTDVQERGFRYPYRAIDIERTETMKYMLLAEYKIDPYGMSSGCISKSYFKWYDELMRDSIEAVYGKNFFVNKRKLADSLDRVRLGLRLPYIHDSLKTISTLLKATILLDTLRDGLGEKVHFLQIEFKQGRVDHATICTWSWAGVQPDYNFWRYDEMLTHDIARMRWHGPTYKGRPANVLVYFDRKTGTLTF